KKNSVGVDKSIHPMKNSISPKTSPTINVIHFGASLEFLTKEFRTPAVNRTTAPLYVMYGCDSRTLNSASMIFKLKDQVLSVFWVRVKIVRHGFLSMPAVRRPSDCKLRYTSLSRQVLK